ncbi:peptidoglycan-recognition protein 2-like [Macrosteles quadrilineatus]|uniref:peptidoglycan-recognition protein 2-like n=1 Tax=Macrosteles quadrilineatus TaxID=74068 RepID=UPI0023E32B1B|nr:peptidoglycan-recognition protein 2-like [Macrosteles quadrilineatus]
MVKINRLHAVPIVKRPSEDERIKYDFDPINDVMDRQWDNYPVGPDQPLRMIRRDRWNAVVPRSWQFQPIPVKAVLVMPTNTYTCLSNSACMKIVWRLQKHQLRSGLRDIQWNFLIGGCGRVYEGRGWDRRPAKNPIHKPWDYKSLDVAFIGRFGTDVHPCMRDQLNELICYGLKHNLIRNSVTEYYEYERLNKRL